MIANSYSLLLGLFFVMDSSVAYEFVILEDTVLDTTVGEYPHTLSMIIIVFKRTDVILTAWEENSSVSVELIVLIEAFVNLVIIKNFATDAIQKITALFELSNIDFVWELDLLELEVVLVKVEIGWAMVDNILNGQWLEFLPVFN